MATAWRPASNVLQALSVVLLLCAMTVGAEAQFAPIDPAASSGDAAIRAWKQQVSMRIARSARRLADAGLHGRATICVAIDRNGRLVEITVLRSSGNSDVDGAALAVVRKAGPFPRLPRTYTKPVFAAGQIINFVGL
ncbi:TonB family protein [Bradyrhizobium sp. NFR13]|uniref:energy transducer TonB n=1 Tax=Bradyrhizobium sp. NFR13 TaxID=1566285 RepID=UPI000B892534|nr:TonB family protein [Bradyrhizobium sp. NFR13]